MSASRKVIVFTGVLGVIALILSVYYYKDEVWAMLLRLDSVVDALGPFGPLGIALFAAVWSTLCLPGPLIQGAILVLFISKPLIAFGVIAVSEAISQAVAFLLARFAGREYFKARFQDQTWFKRLEKGVIEKGLYGVAFFRLIPMFPNAMANYAFGLTNLRFWPYLLASIFGSTPKTVVVVGGAAGVFQFLGGVVPGF